MTTIGSDLTIPLETTTSCTPAPTFFQQSLTGRQVTALTAGVVVRWRLVVGLAPVNVKLRIIRAASAGTFTGINSSESVQAALGTNEFPTRLAIQAGDFIGVDAGAGENFRAFATNSGAVRRSFYPALADGETRAPSGCFDNDDLEILLNADIEPDADGDGFGDETQDQCPTDASTQGPCPVVPDTDPPETKITKGAPNKPDKTKLKFKFTSSEPGSTFECKLDKKALKPCTSPRKVKRLDDGKHKFKVVATDAAGNTDPSAAKDKFKVVG